MVDDGLNWRMKQRRRALILSAVLLPLLAFAASAVHAQSVMRSPNLNVGSRVPAINPVAPRITPNIAARPNVGVNTVARTRPDLGAQSTLSVARFPTNPNSACQNAARGADGECSVTSAGRRQGWLGQELGQEGKGRGGQG